jgi:S1-C subfamily serine protease
VDQDLAKALDLPSADGVLISDVEEGGPASSAGLERGDVVLSIDGNKTDSTGRLRNLVASAGSGKAIQMEVLRNKKKKNISVKLGKMPTDLGRARRGRLAPDSGKLEGLVLEGLSDANRRRFDIEKGVRQGVVVVEVEPGSAAASAGLRQGDVILEVNRHQVASLDGFRKLFGTGKGVRLLLVHRDRNSIFLVLRG